MLLFPEKQKKIKELEAEKEKLLSEYMRYEYELGNFQKINRDKNEKLDRVDINLEKTMKKVDEELMEKYDVSSF